ncbi:MAG TPA: hypothetical protein VGR35_06900 [Tepidisphaeraceae bacterium]|nr:hypothetical protein [Tepidisphaeraceae bacterium]
MFAAQLLAPRSSPGNANARQILKVGDEDLYDALPSYSKQFKGLVPVAVTGSREPIQIAILRGLRVAISGLSGSGVQSLTRRVTRLLDQAGADVPGDRELLDVVTSAAELVAGDSGGASGLFLVVDELGKVLEYTAAHPNHSDVYVLQHLAELAARSSVPILILTILHKDFSGYADRLSSHEKAEWEKVRGRFEDIVFEESADEILRLIAHARTNAADGDTQLFTTPSISDKDARRFTELVDQAWRLHLAPPGMAKPEFVSLLKQCWPLHPLVAILLGPVFRKLAQNERSVFSFLASHEPHGLLDFLDSSRGPSAVYGVDRMYDYLWNSIGEGLYSQRNGKKWAEVESALERLPDGMPGVESILKTIGVISAIGGTKNIQATSDVIRFGAAGVTTASEFSDAIKQLEMASAITYRKYNGTFGLWEGSDVDIDERVKVARDRVGDGITLAALGNRFVALRPIVARRHSFETGTLRYFSVEFVEPTNLATEAAKKGESDGRILIVLPANAEERAVVDNTVKTEAIAKQPRVIIAVPAEIRSIDLCMREVSCMEWVRDNTPELAGDLTARRELRARVADLQRQLDVLATNMLVPSAEDGSTCTWFHAGRQVKIESRRALNDYLSDTCSKVFPKTPRILNELVNRRELSSAAAAARRTLIQWMIEKSGEAGLGIEGYPPEKSMYLSVLAAHGLHKEDEGGWGFGPPSKPGDRGMKEVWAAIQAYFDSSEKEPRTVEGLFELLRAEPFGLRDGLLPLLLCAALIANEADVALYEEGSFVPQLNVGMFERLMKSPSVYGVKRWRISGVRATVFRQLAEMLGKKWVTSRITKRNVLDVVRPLLRFVDQLPEHTRTSDQLSDQAKWVRSVLLQTREADQLLFVELPAACGLEPFNPDEHLSGEKLEAFLSEMKRALGELQRHYEMLLADLVRSLGAAFAIEGAGPMIRERLTARAGALREWVADPTLRNFVTRVADSSADERGWIESIASLLCERPPALWRDSDRAKFEVAVRRTSRLLQHLEVLAFGSDAKVNGQSESVRIGVTTRDGGDLERVVHVGADDRARLHEVSNRLRSALEAAGLNGHKEIALAALARVVKDFLS